MKNANLLSAIRMTSSSRDIYFHTPSRNQTKLWPVEKYWLENFIMSAPSLFDKLVEFVFADYLSSPLLLNSSVLAI